MTILKLAAQLLPLFDDQKSFVFIKDAEQRYIDCNLNYAQSLGLKNNAAILGLTDAILNPHYATIYNQDDQKVLAGEVLEINNPAYFKDSGLVTVSGKIIPIRDENNLITGILGTTSLIYSLAHKPFSHAIAMLNAHTIPLIVKRNFYEIKTKYGTVKLSKMETECILFLFKCFTAEDIAQQLQLSNRTIESYFVNIKNKLNVHHKSEILETVITGRLLEQL